MLSIERFTIKIYRTHNFISQFWNRFLCEFAIYSLVVKSHFICPASFTSEYTKELQTVKNSERTQYRVNGKSLCTQHTFNFLHVKPIQGSAFVSQEVSNAN